MRSVFWTAIIICSIAVVAKADEISREYSEKLITGHWHGDVVRATGPYHFQTVNCANGSFATAIMRERQDTFIYFGYWSTDGATMTNEGEFSGTFDQQSLEVLSMKPEHFTNLYHIVELSEFLMIYEWRGDFTRRFVARKTEDSSGILLEKLTHLACDQRPSLS